MYYFCSLESEKKKATKIIFGSRLNIKKKDGKEKRYDRDNAIWKWKTGDFSPIGG